MLTNKELDILDFLATSDGIISVQQLSDVFELSQRSIRNYMDNIIKEMGYDVVDLKKGSYYIKNKKELLTYLNNPDILSLSSELKKLTLLYTFIFEGSVNLSSMAKSLEVSRTTIKIYFDEMIEQLKSYSFTVEPREQKGLFLIRMKTPFEKSSCKHSFITRI